jgi:hypothetical protein
LVFVYGLASATVGPFAFEARPIDMPVAFVLGSLLGVLQLILAPKSDLYSNVFEISAAVLTSFVARAVGSINGGRLFCFSALAQSSIALILPGYTVRKWHFAGAALEGRRADAWDGALADFTAVQKYAVRWSCSRKIWWPARFAWCTLLSIRSSLALASPSAQLCMGSLT